MKRILIVDDQMMYLKSLELALKKQYDVQLATNFDNALKTLREENCDIVLIDIRLDEEDDKNMDGLRILEWLKMNKPEVIPFVMSTYQEFSYAQQALNLGARHFFKKPIDVLSLTAIIKEKS
jgi:DNA-binding NtrC family response regulator